MHATVVVYGLFIRKGANVVFLGQGAVDCKAVPLLCCNIRSR